MPGLNQTGPAGQGPMTGRRMGRCANSGADKKKINEAESEDSSKTTVENTEERGLGLGHGKGGAGRGMGRQNRFRGG